MQVDRVLGHALAEGTCSNGIATAAELGKLTTFGYCLWLCAEPHAGVHAQQRQGT
jgi:hypothetical protein